jgi:hypothetical protein
MSATNIQHWRVKLLADSSSQPDLHQAIPVFHRWIREKAVPESPIDVSDYLHVPAGPGVILVCHEAIYGLDLEKNRLGLMYNRRTALEGTETAKLTQAVEATLSAAGKLEAATEFKGQLRFNRSAWELVINDRALAPNNAQTLAAVKPVVEAAFAPVLGTVVIEHLPAPGELFRLRVTRA